MTFPHSNTHMTWPSGCPSAFAACERGRETTSHNAYATYRAVIQEGFLAGSDSAGSEQEQVRLQCPAAGTQHILRVHRGSAGEPHAGGRLNVAGLMGGLVVMSQGVVHL